MQSPTIVFTSNSKCPNKWQNWFQYCQPSWCRGRYAPKPNISESPQPGDRNFPNTRRFFLLEHICLHVSSTEIRELTNWAGAWNWAEQSVSKGEVATICSDHGHIQVVLLVNTSVVIPPTSSLDVPQLNSGSLARHGTLVVWQHTTILKTPAVPTYNYVKVPISSENSR